MANMEGRKRQGSCWLQISELSGYNSIVIIVIMQICCYGSYSLPLQNGTVATRRVYDLQPSLLIQEIHTPSVEMKPPGPLPHYPKFPNKQSASVAMPSSANAQPPQQQQQQQQFHHHQGQNYVSQPTSQQPTVHYQPLNQIQVQPPNTKLTTINQGSFDLSNGAEEEKWRGLRQNQQQQQQPAPAQAAAPAMQFHSNQVDPAPNQEIQFLIHKPGDLETIKATLVEDAQRNGQDIRFIQGPQLKLRQDQRLYLPPPKKTIVYVMMTEPNVDLNVEVMENPEMKVEEPEVYVVYQKPGDGRRVMHHGGNHNGQEQDPYQTQPSNLVNIYNHKGKLTEFGAKLIGKNDEAVKKQKKEQQQQPIMCLTSTSTKSSSSTTSSS